MSVSSVIFNLLSKLKIKNKKNKKSTDFLATVLPYEHNPAAQHETISVWSKIFKTNDILHALL